MLFLKAIFWLILENQKVYINSEPAVSEELRPYLKSCGPAQPAGKIRGAPSPCQAQCPPQILWLLHLPS